MAEIAGELKGASVTQIEMKSGQVKGTVSEKKYFIESRLIDGNHSSRLCPKGILALMALV